MTKRNFNIELLTCIAAVALGLIGYQATQAIAAPPQPSLLSISPISGPTAGGTTVTLNGSNFDSTAVITFGPSNAMIVSVSPNTITVSTPASPAGTVNVTVTENGGYSTLVNAFTFVPPQPPPPPPTDNGDCDKDKIAICHVPDGNKGNPQPLCLPQSAIPAHLAKGDYLGSCKDYIKNGHGENDDHDKSGK